MSVDDDKDIASSSVQSEYDEIADEAIETLNQSGDFSNTEIEEPARVKAIGAPLWHRPWFAVICSLLVANVVYYYAARDLAANPLDRATADLESKKLLAEVPELGTVLNEVSGRLAAPEVATPQVVSELVEDLLGEVQAPGHSVKANKLPCQSSICFELKEESSHQDK
jgi:hypothetical protein